MDFEQALYTELTSISGIGKVFPLDVIEGTKPPFCVYESSDGIQEKTLDGYVSSKEINGNIYVVQMSYQTMKSVSEAVISLLQSFQSRLIGGTASGVFVYDITYQKAMETYDSNTFFYQCEINFSVRI